MQATCYLMTNRGTLMPSRMLGTTDDGLVEVASPNGVVYTARPDAVVAVDEAAQMLRQRRAEKLVDDGYKIIDLGRKRYQVWNPKRHDGPEVGYTVTILAEDVFAGAVPRLQPPGKLHR